MPARGSPSRIWSKRESQFVALHQVTVYGDLEVCISPALEASELHNWGLTYTERSKREVDFAVRLHITNQGSSNDVASLASSTYILYIQPEMAKMKSCTCVMHNHSAI
eukprot:9130-Heterococcus_DN1.PRE.2